jgi:hypothetical protein
MTCRLCGVRIGILERWRHGEFCSREHKEEFALENERLAEEILRDLRKPSASEPVSIARLVTPAPEPEPAAAEAEEPDPAMAGHLPQHQGSPLRPPAPARDEAPKTKPGWKEFASLANLDRVPPAPSKKAAAAASRQIWIEQKQVPDGERYARGAKRPLGAPHWHYRRRRPGLRLYDQLLPIDPPLENAAPAVAGAPGIWPGWGADAQSGWGMEGGEAWTPGIGDVLEDYPLTAPWDRWERWPVAAPAPLKQQVQDPRIGAPPLGTAGLRPGAMARPAIGAMGPRAQSPGGGFRSGPAPAPRPGGPAGGSLPGLPGMPGTPGLPGLAAGLGITMPSFPGMGPAYGVPAGGGSGARGGPVFVGSWREMAPPMFLAQSDPAADLDPLDRPRRVCPLANAFAHGRPRIFRPRPRLLPPPPRVPESSSRRPVALRLADVWSPKPPEPARWRP